MTSPYPPSARIAFGIMTATENPAAVRQLIQAIGPEHPVFIHHDFTKQANFTVGGDNVQLIRHPMSTGWGTWGFVQGVLLLMRTAFERSDCDYFQLLSGTCLPLRPVAEMAMSLALQPQPINADMVNLDENSDAMMSFGFRVFTPDNTTGFRVLRRLRGIYFGPDDAASQIQHRSLALPSRPPSHRGLIGGSVPGLAGLLMRAARHGLFRHPFASQLTPFIGSTWFGCRREVAERLLARPLDGELEVFAQKLLLCDEIYLPSALGNLGVEVASSNHYVSRFEGPHPKTMSVRDLPDAWASGRFFGRKFSNDPRDPARLRVLNTLTTHEPRAEAVADVDRAA